MALKIFKTDASTGGGLYRGYEKAQREVEAPVIPVRNADVGVFSIKHGVGVSYIAESFANFLSEDKENAVALFSDQLSGDKDAQKDVLSRGVDCFALKARESEIRRYNSIVEDGGCIDLYGALPYGKRLIMVCTPDWEFMRTLCSFAKEREAECKDIYFLFNLVPESRVSEIARTMEFYRLAGCIGSVYDVRHIPRDIKLLLRNILVQ